MKVGSNLKKKIKRILIPIIGILCFSNVSVEAGSKTLIAGKSIQQSILGLQPGDTLFVRSGDYHETLSFPQGGVDGQPIVISAFPGDHPVLFSTGTGPIILGEDYLVMDGLILDQNGASEDAIRIRGNYNTIKNCEIRNGKRDAIEINSGTGNRIENNVIHNFVWQPGKDAHGIVTDPGVVDLTIIGNTIYDCGGDCIQLYASGSDPVSSYSRDIDIIDNVLYTTLGSSSENALDFKGVDGGIVAGNDMYGFDDKAVVVQKGCRNLLFEFNTIHDSERGMEFRGENGKSQENMIVRNNAIYNIRQYYGVKFDWVDNVTFINNTLAFINTRAFLIEEEGLTNSVILNNIIYQADDPKVDGTFDVEVGHNGWFQADAASFAAASDVVGQNPGFMAANSFDFQLISGSPVIDKGQNVGLVFTGNAPDLGAFEFGVTAAVSENLLAEINPPMEFTLQQNWPNPFSTAQSHVTRIPVEIHTANDFSISIYNVLGQTVKQIFKGELVQGNHEIQWDGRNQFGQRTSPGVYYYEIRSNKQRVVKSLILLN
ncbi:MAG: T9SS C-terminal target domain-containing protein [Calditrichaeota bacterium]|nr:MAG: T9SS C-terminal target domain-containing protein [Calditrichota bacterium]